jgi:glycosyltransferase involved in cell wall biosynthesis
MTWGLLRVKNEARWIERAIVSICPICDRILVLDDHSTDGTPEICAAAGCTVFRSEFEGVREARDKDWLLARCWEAGAAVGDCCLMIDGDEALHLDDVGELRKAIARGVICGSMRIVYLWDREDQARVDGVYRRFRRPSLFRLTHRGLSFLRTGNGGEFHCSSVPADLLQFSEALPVRLLHYGYMLGEDRIRKYNWYNQIDPRNRFEDGYRHIVIGDIFPAESVFRHAGPLELEKI